MRFGASIGRLCGALLAIICLLDCLLKGAATLVQLLKGVIMKNDLMGEAMALRELLRVMVALRYQPSKCGL